METRKIRDHARQATINKYTTYLKSALIKINRDPFFCGLEFCRENRLTVNFFRGLTELKYISTTKEGTSTKYLALVNPKTVTQEDGKRVAEYSLAYNYNHTNLMPKYIDSDSVTKKIGQLISSPREIPSLKLFTDEELLDELKRRGYE